MPERILKPGWTWVKFGDVVRQVKDQVDARSSGLKWYVAGEHMDTDDLHIRRRGEITGDYLGPAFHMRFKPGQVLYGSRRTYLRKVAVADFEGICANTTFVLEPRDTSILLPDLLPFIMQTEAFHGFSIQNSKGSVNPYINFSDLAEYGFALPPLAEQRRIVEVLIGYTEAYESLYSGIAVAKNLRHALALHLFESDLSTKRVLKEVIADSLYGPRFSSELYDDAGAIGQLRTTDIDQDGEISYGTIPRARLDPDEYDMHLLQDGDIVISRSGTCGLTAVFREQATPIVAGAFLIRLRTTGDMLSEYLHEFLSSPRGRQLTASLARGGVQKNISGSTLLAQAVPCPALPKQAEVVLVLAQARASERAMKQRIDRIVRLRRLFLLELSGDRQ